MLALLASQIPKEFQPCLLGEIPDQMTSGVFHGPNNFIYHKFLQKGFLKKAAIYKNAKDN